MHSFSHGYGWWFVKQLGNEHNPNLSDLAALSDPSPLSLEDVLGFSWWSVCFLVTADFSPMVILSRETDLPPALPLLEVFRSVFDDLSPSVSLSTVTGTFCEPEPDALSLSRSDVVPLSLSRSDPEARSRSRSLSSPELLLWSLSEPWCLSPALPGLSLETPLSADADRSFLPAPSAVLLCRSPSELWAADERSDVEVVFSGPDDALSEGAVSVLPFLPRSRFNFIFLWVVGFTWIWTNRHKLH